MLCGFESVSCSCERFGKCCVGLSRFPVPVKKSVSCSCERFGKCCVGLSRFPVPVKGLVSVVWV